MFKIKKDKTVAAGPNQLIGSIEQMASKARQYLSTLVLGIAVLLAIGSAVGGFLWFRHHDNRVAEDMLHEGMRIFSERSPGLDTPPPEQLQKAVETFRKVLTEHPRSDAAPQAAYMLGNTLSDLKDWSAAVKAYEDFLARYDARGSIGALVYQRLAYAYLSLGKLDEAEKTLLAILKNPEAPNKDHALYELAKMDEVLNRPEGALAHYQELMKQHPQSPYAEEAAIRIKTLDAKTISGNSPAGQSAPGTPAQK
jgi:tetratricopeptide (TPR) repeat protein